MRNKGRSIIAAAYFLLVLPGIARADNCGDAIDCHPYMFGALLAMLAILFFIAIWPMLPMILAALDTMLTAYGFFEVGKALLTGEKLAWWQIALDLAPGVKYLGKIPKIAEFIKAANITGSAIGHINAAEKILAKTGLKPNKINEVIRAFAPGTLKVVRVDEDMTVYRYYDEVRSSAFNRWTTPDMISNIDDRIRLLALPNSGADKVIQVIIPKGSTILVGKVAPQVERGAHLTGGGNQIFLPGNLNEYLFTNF